MSEKLYYIALASDENNKIPLMVTIFSALENKNKDTNYRFVIMTPGEFTEDSINDVKILVDRYPGSDVVFVNMADEYKNADLRIEHITTPTYYRLSLPDIVKNSKCLYIDTDVIVCKDLRELFDIDLEGYYIAGVKAAGFYSSEKAMSERADYLKIPKFDQYVNAGILMMNLEEIRKDNLIPEFKESIKLKLRYQDQDVINKVCYGKIKIIPPKYNSLTMYNKSNSNTYESDEYAFLRKCYTKDEWITAITDPTIIHYANNIKPWESFAVYFSNVWWKYLYKMNSFYDCLDEVLDNATVKELSRTERIEKKNRGRIEELTNQRNELKEKLQMTYQEKSEINSKLQITYKEKSEINAKLQVTYGEKAERGVKLKEQKKEIKELGKK